MNALVIRHFAILFPKTFLSNLGKYGYGGGGGFQGRIQDLGGGGGGGGEEQEIFRWDNGWHNVPPRQASRGLVRRGGPEGSAPQGDFFGGLPQEHLETKVL